MQIEIICVFSSLSPHLHVGFMMPCKDRILVHLWGVRTQKATKWAQDKHVIFMTELLEVQTVPKGYALHMNQNLL